MAEDQEAAIDRMVAAMAGVNQTNVETLSEGERCRLRDKARLILNTLDEVIRGSKTRA